MNSNNPPKFESEASFLDRNGLLLPGEKRRVPKAGWEDETLAYVDDE